MDTGSVDQFVGGNFSDDIFDRAFFLDSTGEFGVNVLSNSSTQIVVANEENASRTTTVTGTGFTFNAQGDPTGGTIETFTFRSGTTVLGTITGISISLVDFVAALEASGLGNDGPLDAIFAPFAVDYDASASTGGVVADIASTLGDTLTGSNFNDVLIGGSGGDTVFGGNGNDTITTGAGNDLVIVTQAGIGADRYDGGAGVDSISWSSLNLVGHVFNLTAGTVSDGVNTQTMVGFENLAGSQGGDDIRGTAAANLLIGNGGGDFIKAFAGNDRLEGGDGADTLDGGDGDDELFGDAQNDRIIAGRGSDTVFGGGGDDFMRGDQQADRMLGGVGNDRILGNGGADSLFGQAGNDVIDGGGGGEGDTLDGGAGIDRLFGRAGVDTITGGRGKDKLQGGSEGDIFVFSDGDGIDDVIDWEDGLDVIDLTGHATLNSLVDVLAIAREAPGGRLFIGEAGDDNIIVLRNMTLAQLDASDFLF